VKIEKIAAMLVNNYTNENRRKRTVFLLGPSGVGKSDSIREAADQLAKQFGCDFPVIDKRLSQMEPPDFGGVPSVENRRTVTNPQGWFPTDPDSRGFLLLDEITSAPPVMQAAAYQVALDRAMGDSKLPDGWMVVTAGNRASDRGVTYPLAAPLLARMTLINVESSLDGFMYYCAAKSVRPEIQAFIKSRADYLNERDETINPKIADLPIGKPFANQRSWTAAAQYYLDETPQDRLELLRGCIGDRAAGDLEVFLRVWESMPNIDQIYLDPDSVAAPTDAATRYAVAVGVSVRINKDNFETALRYLKRMPGDFRALAIKLAYKRDKSVAMCEAFASFVTENPDLWKHGV